MKSPISVQVAQANVFNPSGAIVRGTPVCGIKLFKISVLFLLFLRKLNN